MSASGRRDCLGRPLFPFLGEGHLGGRGNVLFLAAGLARAQGLRGGVGEDRCSGRGQIQAGTRAPLPSGPVHLGKRVHFSGY